MSVPECVRVHHVHVMPEKARRGAPDPLEQELQVVVTCYMGARIFCSVPDEPSAVPIHPDFRNFSLTPTCFTRNLFLTIPRSTELHTAIAKGL